MKTLVENQWQGGFLGNGAPSEDWPVPPMLWYVCTSAILGWQHSRPRLKSGLPSPYLHPSCHVMQGDSQVVRLVLPIPLPSY